MPSIPRPLGPKLSARRKLQGQAQESLPAIPSSKPLANARAVSLPLLVAKEMMGSRSLPALPGRVLPVQNARQMVAPPWRSVHVYDHVVEHHHFHVYNGELATLTEARLAGPVEQPFPPMLTRHHSEPPAAGSANTRLMEVQRALDAKPMPAASSSSATAQLLQVKDSNNSRRPSKNSCRSSGDSRRSSIESVRSDVSSIQRFMVDRADTMEVESELERERSEALQKQVQRVASSRIAQAAANIPVGEQGEGENSSSSAAEGEDTEPEVRVVKGSYAVQALRREMIRAAGTLREAFKQLDTNGNGTICLTEFLTGLTSMRIDLTKIPGKPKPRDLFHELADVDPAHHPHANFEIDVWQLLGIKAQEGSFDHVNTHELWKKHETGKRTIRAEGRLAMWTEAPEIRGEMQVARLEGQDKEKKELENLKLDWRRTRSARDACTKAGRLEVLGDPRLHRKCAREAIRKRNEALVVKEQGMQWKKLNNIKKAMNACADSRHQVKQMQHLLRPPEEKNPIKESLSVSFAEALRKSATALNFHAGKEESEPNSPATSRATSRATSKAN